MKLRVKTILFASLADGGHMQLVEAVDYPGIQVATIKDDRKSPWRRVIVFEGQEAATLADAVALHTAAHPLA